MEIDAPPFAYNPHGGMFDGHRFYPRDAHIEATCRYQVSSVGFGLIKAWRFATGAVTAIGFTSFSQMATHASDSNLCAPIKTGAPLISSTARSSAGLISLECATVTENGGPSSFSCQKARKS